MKNKFILIISLFSLVVLKTTAQNTFVNTSPKKIQSSKNPFLNINYSNSQSDFCSYECLEASGFKQMHEEECQYYNDEWLQESYFWQEFKELKALKIWFCM